MEDNRNRLEEIERRLREQDRKEVEAEDKAKRKQARSVLWLVFANPIMIYGFISQEPLPLLFSIIILIGDIFAFKNLGAF